MPFKSISDDQKNAFLHALRAGQYNLLLGAGSSADASNALGNLPVGNTLRDDLCDLKGVSRSYSLQKVFGLLSDAEIEACVTQRFAGAKAGDTANALTKFLWKRIFTWNIDDVLQAAYRSPEAKQKIETIHFDDEFVEWQTLTDLMVVHLHGTVLAPDKGYVFSRDQYVGQINRLNHWMVVLTQFMLSEPMIISGTSMDEVDLDYYLAHRTTATSREDRGPSIFVTRADDAIVSQFCERHNLLHFVGRTNDFLDYCSSVLPHPPTPEDLIPAETAKLIPAGVSKNSAVSFAANFELVPSIASPGDATRFLYGHPPTWADLAYGMDVSRPVASKLVVEVEAKLANLADPERVLLLSESAGTGKTTILRRVGFELAKRGIKVMLCSTLGRLDKSAASVIDLIDEPLVFLVDDFGDQVTAIPDLLDRLEKKDVVFLAAERGYRNGHIKQLMGTIPYQRIEHLPLETVEAERLIEQYAAHGLLGDHTALKHRSSYGRKVAGDPIAVACCRIMNDFKPLDRIIGDVIGDATINELDRYLVAAVAQVCFTGGVRYEVLVSAATPGGVTDQLHRSNPLPLAFADPAKTFVVPQNSTIAERILNRAIAHDQRRLLSAFVELARAIRPRVNRTAIKRRTPEARLAGRLFDYDDIVSKYLRGNSEEFYKQTKDVWQWNSRYWEQVALLNLKVYYSNPDSDEGRQRLDIAVQHARHAVAIELHPFSLTTLGKVLMAQMLASDAAPVVAVYSEALEKLSEAIDKEASWSRWSIQPFITLFAGTMKFIEHGGRLLDKQRDKLDELIKRAEPRALRDKEFQGVLDSFRRELKSK